MQFPRDDETVRVLEMARKSLLDRRERLAQLYGIAGAERTELQVRGARPRRPGDADLVTRGDPLRFRHGQELEGTCDIGHRYPVHERQVVRGVRLVEIGAMRSRELQGQIGRASCRERV